MIVQTGFQSGTPALSSVGGKQYLLYDSFFRSEIKFPILVNELGMPEDMVLLRLGITLAFSKFVVLDFTPSKPLTNQRPFRYEIDRIVRWMHKGPSDECRCKAEAKLILKRAMELLE